MSIPKVSMPISPSFQKSLKALGFMYKKKPSGYMTCLKSFVDMKIIDEFKSVGFLKTGYCRKGQTFSLTKLGKQYYKEYYHNLEV